MALQDNRLQPEAFSLQQRVELPIWHPEGMRGLHDDTAYDEEGEEETVADDPRPEEWLPQVMVDVCQDILQVLEALDSVRSQWPLNKG